MNMKYQLSMLPDWCGIIPPTFNTYMIAVRLRNLSINLRKADTLYLRERILLNPLHRRHMNLLNVQTNKFTKIKALHFKAPWEGLPSQEACNAENVSISGRHR